MRVLPEDFTNRHATELPPRTIGTECEHNLQVQYGLASYVDDKALATAGIAHHLSFLGLAGGAGRLYIDVGHVEYATAACMGPASAAVADLDGSLRIVPEVIRASGRTHDGLYRMVGSYLPQVTPQGRTTDAFTSGDHLNLAIPRNLVHDPLLNTFLPTVLACRPYARAGTLLGSGYVFSQKIWGIGGSPVERQVTRRATHGLKPMVLIPPKLADSDTMGSHGFARVELRDNEGTLGLIGNFAGKAAASLALRLIEQQHLFKRGDLQNLSFLDPVGAARRFAASIALRATARTYDGKRMTQLDAHEAQLERMRYLSERVGLPADEQFAIPLIGAIIDALRRSKPQRHEYAGVARRLDIAARHQFLAAGTTERLSTDNAEAVRRNQAWDRIDPEGPGVRYWRILDAKSPGLPDQIHAYAAQYGLAPREYRRAAIIDDPSSSEEVVSWTGARKRGTSNVRSFGSPYAS